MSFGKDPSQLPVVGNYRQSVAAHEENRPKGGGGGGKGIPLFLTEFEPTESMNGDWIRVLRGPYPHLVGKKEGTTYSTETQYNHFYPYTNHFDRVVKYGFHCSAGPFIDFREKREPCRGCDLFWIGNAKKKSGGGDNMMGKSTFFAFSVIHYHPYVLAEAFNEKTNSVVVDPTTNQPYMNWKRLMPNEVVRYQNYKQVEARALHWSVGYHHNMSLQDAAARINYDCTGCAGRGTIAMDALICQKCGDAIVETANTSYSPDEIDKLSVQRVKCPSCGNHDFLNQMISCSSCTNPGRADIFDVDLNIKLVSDPSGKVKGTTLQVLGWRVCPIDARFQELAQPLDLPAMFGPTPVADQETRLGSRMAEINTPSGQAPGQAPGTMFRGYR